MQFGLKAGCFLGNTRYHAFNVDQGFDIQLQCQGCCRRILGNSDSISVIATDHGEQQAHRQNDPLAAPKRSPDFEKVDLFIITKLDHTVTVTGTRRVFNFFEH